MWVCREFAESLQSKLIRNCQRWGWKGWCQTIFANELMDSIIPIGKCELKIRKIVSSRIDGNKRNVSLEFNGWAIQSVREWMVARVFGSSLLFQRRQRYPSLTQSNIREQKRNDIIETKRVIKSSCDQCCDSFPTRIECSLINAHVEVIKISILLPNDKWSRWYHLNRIGAFRMCCTP